MALDVSEEAAGEEEDWGETVGEAVEAAAAAGSVGAAVLAF